MLAPRMPRDKILFLKLAEANNVVPDLYRDLSNKSIIAQAFQRKDGRWLLYINNKMLLMKDEAFHKRFCICQLRPIYKGTGSIDTQGR